MNVAKKGKCLCRVRRLRDCSAVVYPVAALRPLFARSARFAIAAWKAMITTLLAGAANVINDEIVDLDSGIQNGASECLRLADYCRRTKWSTRRKEMDACAE